MGASFFSMTKSRSDRRWSATMEPGSVEIEKKLGSGEHTLRADTYDIKTGMVAGRASVSIGREAATEAAAATEALLRRKICLGAAARLYPEAAGEAGQPIPRGSRRGGGAPKRDETSGQPQPVYPNGPPADLEASSPARPTSLAHRKICRPSLSRSIRRSRRPRRQNRPRRSLPHRSLSPRPPSRLRR